MDIVQNNKIFKKECKDYFVILNLNYNALFMFHKDVEVVWNYVNSQTNMEKLYNDLVEDGYDIEKNDLNEIIVLFAKLGIVKVSDVLEDTKTIKEYDQFETYIDFCCSKNIPTILHVETTNICNLNCKHCYHDEATNYVSFDDIERVFKELEKSSFVRVTLTGGEVGLHPLWREIMACAEAHGLSVAILSNLTSFNEDDLCYIANNSPLFVRTSLYGFCKETHDNITGCVGSFDATIKNLLVLKNKNVNVSVSCTVMQDNFTEIHRLKSMMDGYCIPIEFGCSILPSRNDTKPIDTLMINHSQYLELKEAKILSDAKKIPCMAGFHRIAIDQNGDIYSCDSLRISIGNIKNTTVINSLNGEKMKLIRKKIDSYYPDKCKTCYCESICTMCPGLVWSQDHFDNVHSNIQCFYTKTYSCMK